ncbi:MAG: hypothetical protein KAW12_25815 [Candidatus Aminicenantes bacterium]|nr:hypothetical protein [Candidatus Aminicenantes bacterium]
MNQKSCKITAILFLFVITASLHAEKMATLTEISQAKMIAVAGEKLYISEPSGFSVYSLKTFQLLKKVGEKGQGPGEFLIAPLIRFAGDKPIFLDRRQRKIVFYSNDFQVIKEHRFLFDVFDVIPIGGNYAIFKDIVIKKNIRFCISLFDGNFKNIKTISKQGNILDSKSGYNYTIRPFYGVQCWLDKIYVVDGRKGFFIEVFDQNGNFLYKINKKYEKIKTTDIHKKNRYELLKQYPVFKKFPLSHWKFPEYLPAIKAFFVIDNKIFVKTYHVKGGKEEYIVMDLKGNEQKRVFLPFVIMRFFALKNGKFYYLKDNEISEEWELHVIDIEKAGESR